MRHPRQWHRRPPVDVPARLGPEHPVAVRLVMTAAAEPWPGEAEELPPGGMVRLEDADTGRRIPVTGKIRLRTEAGRPVSARVELLITEISVD